MNGRERIKTAISRHVPDRMPVFADFVPEVKQKMLDYFNTTNYYEMCVRAGNDMLTVPGNGLAASFYGPGEEYTCRWGCHWKRFYNREGAYTEIVDAPLLDDEDGKKLAEYQIPDPDDAETIRFAEEIIQRYGKTHWICAELNCSIFEAAWYLHGLEDTTIDMISNPDYMNALMDKVMQYPLRMGLNMIDAGIDMIWLGDDVGMQSQMMISPEMWRKYLKPRMEILIEAFKTRNPRVTVAYHSCGCIFPIIDDLIEIGLDVLNPVQPHAMDPAEVKRSFGDRLSFWGAIDIQNTLPHGTETDIRNEVLLRKDTIGAAGGYICAPAHTVQADTSLENMLAFYRAVRELGYYDKL